MGEDSEICDPSKIEFRKPGDCQLLCKDMFNYEKYFLYQHLGETNNLSSIFDESLRNK